MKHEKKVKFDDLKSVSICAWLLRLVPIPITIIFAKLSAILISYATDGNVNDTILVAVVVIFGTILYKTFDIISNIAYERMANKALHKCKMSFYKQFLSNQLSVLYSSKHGHIIQNLNDDFTTITDKNLSLYPIFGTGVITILSYSIFLLIENSAIFIILLVISLVQIIPPLIIKKYMQINYESCNDIEAKLTDFVVAGYSGFDTIKLYGLKQWWLSKLSQYHKQYMKVGSASIYTGTAEGTMGTFLDNFLKYGTYAIVGVFILWEYTSIDVGIQVIALSGGLYGGVKSIFSLYPRFSVVKTAENRVVKWFCGKEKSSEIIKTAEVKLSNMSFSYEKNKLYKDTTISFNCDKIIIVKGANGIGKSTLLQLITGLQCHDDGLITTGGVKTDCLSADNFSNNIFYLSQDDACFDFTTDELYKMVFGQNTKTFTDIATQFGLSDEILYKTKISDLSGGERKKVFLALAFSVNPKILFLDEPTNSLDESGKTVLIKLLKKRDGGALIITHDLQLDNIAQHKYLLHEGGEIVEER